MTKKLALVGVVLTFQAGCASPSQKDAATSGAEQVPHLHFDGNIAVSTADLDSVTLLDHPARKTDALLFSGRLAVATQHGVEAAQGEAPPLERADARNVLGPERADLLASDVSRLFQLYYDRGYVMARIAEPVVTRSRDGHAIDVAIHIDEGARFRIGKITLADADAAAGDPILSTPLVSKDGDWFSRATFMKDVDQLRVRYAQAGFPSADLDAATDLDPAHSTLDLTVAIRRNAAGPKVPPNARD